MANKLYYGDNLEILRTKVKDESVELCYIDPPFNSKRNWNQIYNQIGNEDRAQNEAFEDTWSWTDRTRDGCSQILSNYQGRFTSQTIELIQALRGVLGNENNLFAYLVSITLRIAEIHRVLTPTGSFYLHCDPVASHYLKMILDSVFLPAGGNFLNEIIWKRVHTVKGNFGQGSAFFGPNTDTLLFYSKADKHTFNPVFSDYSEEYIKKFYRYSEVDGRRYRLISMIGPGGAAKGNPKYECMGVTRYWRYSKEKMNELLKSGMIVQTRPGAVPQRKQYLDKGKGVACQSLWDDIQALSPTAEERIGYPTQKPAALLERVIFASSREGDLILDAYCGCGTTVAVAQSMNRKWIGIDITYQAISTILARLEKKFGREYVKTIQLDGIPKDMKSALALAHKTDDRPRKEFEKWAILTYTENRAVINQKKGADRGIDGLFYFWNGGDGEVGKMILQAKSGAVQRKDIATLRGDMARENAALGCLITLEEPTAPMNRDASAAGVYENKPRGIKCDRIRIVRVEDIIHGDERLDLPLHSDALSKALRDAEGTQLTLNLKVPSAEESGSPARKAPVSVSQNNKAKAARQQSN
jgi:DNA modification methylase